LINPRYHLNSPKRRRLELSDCSVSDVTQSCAITGAPASAYYSMRLEFSAEELRKSNSVDPSARLAATVWSLVPARRRCVTGFSLLVPYRGQRPLVRGWTFRQRLCFSCAEIV